MTFLKKLQQKWLEYWGKLLSSPFSELYQVTSVCSCINVGMYLRKKKFFKTFTLRVGGWGQLSRVNDKQRHIQQNSPQINSLWPWLFYAMHVCVPYRNLPLMMLGSPGGKCFKYFGIGRAGSQVDLQKPPNLSTSLRLQTDPDCWLSSVRKILRAHRALETYLLIYKLWAWIILLASVSRSGLESLWCSSLKNGGCKLCISLLA